MTNDGRSIIGELRGCDNMTNVVLQGSFERIYSEDQGVVVNELGVQVIRGDNISLVAEVDEAKVASIDHSQQRAAPLKAVTH